MRSSLVLKYFKTKGRTLLRCVMQLFKAGGEAEFNSDGDVLSISYYLNYENLPLEEEEEKMESE